MVRRSRRSSRHGDISANAQGARCPTGVAGGFRAAVADTKRLSMRLAYDDYLIDTIAVNPGARMDTVTISPKFQVVIPQAVREALKLTPGEKMRVLHFGNRVELLRVRDAKELRGLLAGMDTAIERDTDRV